MRGRGTPPAGHYSAAVRDQAVLGALAVLVGLLVAIVAFVPFVAVAYRRRGGLRGRDYLTYLAVLVYAMAIWTYTLLPLPDPAVLHCTNPQLDVLQFVSDLRHALSSGHPLTSPQFLQLALNVLLFVPLGFFVRVVGNRGVLVALGIGLAVSLLVETTQLTGVWGLYPCSYRVFDVDDLLTNTLGAVTGSLLALLLPRRYRTRVTLDPGRPRPVTAGRRLVAMVCDLLTVVLVQVAISLGVQLVAYAAAGRAGLDDTDGWLGPVSTYATLGLTLLFTLATGRTVGDAAVQLRYVGSPLPPVLVPAVRFLGGIGGYQLVIALAPGWTALVWIAASLVLVLVTADRRGLPGLVAAARLADSRTPAPLPT